MQMKAGAAGIGVLLTQRMRSSFSPQTLVKLAVALKRHLICYVGTVSMDQICLLLIISDRPGWPISNSAQVTFQSSVEPKG